MSFGDAQLYKGFMLYLLTGINVRRLLPTSGKKK